MRVNAIQVLQENYFSSDDRDNISFFEYVSRESYNNPDLFGWLFDNGEYTDMHDLREDEKDDFRSFLNEAKRISMNMDYIVVRHIYGDDDPMFSVTRRNNFSVIPYHDTYDHNGGFDYSCDYTVEENDNCFYSFKQAVYDKFRLVVEREGNSGLLYVNPETDEAVAINTDMENFIRQWREENESIPMVTAWNYYDGHNWRSIILDYGDINAEPFYEEVVGEIADDILSQFNGSANDCINGMYETKDFVFKSSRSQSDPWIAHVDFA